MNYINFLNNKVFLALVSLNLVLLLGGCYTARWYEPESATSSSKYWDIRASSYVREDFDSTGNWGITMSVFPKNVSYSKFAYNIDSVTVKIDRTDEIFSLKVDSQWVEYFGDSSLRLEFRSELFNYPINETIRVLISSTIETFEKSDWRLLEEASISISGFFVVKRRNKIFPGN